MIEIRDIQRVLAGYGISEEIADIAALQETQYPDGGTRLVFRIDLAGGRRLVGRASSEKNGSARLVEQQSRFSEKLRLHGVPAARKISAGGKYCTHLSGKEADYLFTLEEYAGTDVDYLDAGLFRIFGGLLGRMHSVSETDPTEIAYSSLSNALVGGRAKFDNILRHADPAVQELPATEALRQAHDGLVRQLKEALSELPWGAVHGDLSVFNNLVTSDGVISVIDFNLAGSEPFLCDMLGSVYSSFYRYQSREQMSGVDRGEAFSQFMSGYCSWRELHDAEIRYFPIAAALFDGLYYCKFLIEEYAGTRSRETLDRFEPALLHFDVPSHSYEMIGKKI